MRSDAIVIVGVGFQDPTQMHLAQDNDVVNTFTPDRSDQPFGKAVLPGRGRCGRLVPDAHGAQSARDDAAIDPVAIADEVVRSLILRSSSAGACGAQVSAVRRPPMAMRRSVPTPRPRASLAP